MTKKEKKNWYLFGLNVEVPGGPKQSGGGGESVRTQVFRLYLTTYPQMRQKNWGGRGGFCGTATI